MAARKQKAPKQAELMPMPRLHQLHTDLLGLGSSDLALGPMDMADLTAAVAELIGHREALAMIEELAPTVKAAA